MSEWALRILAENPIQVLLFVAGLIGIPLGINARQQASRRVHSLGTKTGILAWTAGIVYLANNWPVLARIGRVLLTLAVTVTAVVVWHLHPGPSTYLVFVFGLLLSQIWFYDWIDHQIPTLTAIRQARRRQDATSVIRQAVAASVPEGESARVGRAHFDESGRLSVHVEPAPGQSLTPLEEAALNGAVGNAARQFGQRHGLDLAVSSTIIQPDGASEGEAALVCHTGGDPLADFFHPPETWETGTDAPLVVGTSEMGEDVTLATEPEITLLVGGLKGMGKSVFVASLIDQLAGRDDTALVLCDPKRQEFAPWASRASTIGIDIAGTDVALRLVYLEMKQRQTKYQAKVDSAGELVGEYTRKPSRAECPRIVLVVDEVAEVGSAKPKGDTLDVIATTLYQYGPLEDHMEAATETAQEILRKIVTLGRSANISVILATQRPSATVLPPGIRDNCDVMVGFALRDSTATEMVFGDASVPCHQIPIAAKGVGYLRGQEERSPTKFRSCMMEDERILRTASATRSKRVDLGWPRVVEGPTPPPTMEEDGS